jgi:uncharacterized membrane protein
MSQLIEWIHLVLRWTHVFAGIMWVGTTYYFTWLDGRFTELENLGKNSPPQPDKTEPERFVWMVHSGGFYAVEKQRAPAVLPDKLHWFRWEAAITWLSGFLLLALVYYHGGLLVELEDPRISAGGAMALSLALLIVGWLIYDLLWSSKLAASGAAELVVAAVLVAGTTYALFHYFASRAACLELGAIFGTNMAANVWMRILPAQRRMVAALKEGKEPNQTEARRAKTRSKHNTFMVVPVVFLMLSPHFPGTYNWVTITLLVYAGWIAARFLRRA